MHPGCGHSRRTSPLLNRAGVAGCLRRPPQRQRELMFVPIALKECVNNPDALVLSTICTSHSSLVSRCRAKRINGSSPRDLIRLSVLHPLSTSVLVWRFVRQHGRAHGAEHTADALDEAAVRAFDLVGCLA